MTINDKAKLNDGYEMPRFGLGVFRVEDGKETEQSVLWALEAGYRLVDTASFYNNETGVGKGIKASGVPREEVFITSKVWNGEQGYKSAIAACENSLKRLGTDYLDLYLVHWPGPDSSLRLKTYEALLELKRQQKVKSIGVSNFRPHHLQEVIDTFGETPVVDQVECHPFFPQTELKTFAKQNDIVITAWGPLFHGHLGEAPEVNEIGKNYGKTGAQTVLRWHLQNGTAIIPKSVKQHRIIENADIFDFELSDADMHAIDAMDNGKYFGRDPDTMTFGF